jgi:hypothetical protein
MAENGRRRLVSCHQMCKRSLPKVVWKSGSKRRFKNQHDAVERFARRIRRRLVLRNIRPRATIRLLHGRTLIMTKTARKTRQRNTGASVYRSLLGRLQWFTKTQTRSRGRVEYHGSPHLTTFFPNNSDTTSHLVSPPPSFVPRGDVVMPGLWKSTSRPRKLSEIESQHAKWEVGRDFIGKVEKG